MFRKYTECYIKFTIFMIRHMLYIKTQVNTKFVAILHWNIKSKQTKWTKNSARIGVTTYKMTNKSLPIRGSKYFLKL